jgi:hypothetical protein
VKKKWAADDWINDLIIEATVFGKIIVVQRVYEKLRELDLLTFPNGSKDSGRFHNVKVVVIPKG